MSNNLIESLNWRYATKKFDPAKKIPENELDELLEALRLAPSSYGIQPWKFVVVSDKKTREKLRDEAGYKQPQITDASHLIVLCARKDVDENLIRKYLDAIAKTRGVPRDSLKDFENTLIGFKNNMDEAKLLDWSKKQVYLALGFLLAAAAEKHIDACPMEGFDPAGFDKILGLDKQNATATVICTVGYRKDDKYAGAKKVRFDKKDVFLFK